MSAFLHGIDLQTLAQVPAASLVNASIVSIAIACAAGLLLRLSGRLNSGTRFAVWFLALLAIAALPFFPSLGSHTFGGEGRAPLTISSSWALGVLAAWAAISSTCLLRLGIGLWQVSRLRRCCEDVDEQTLPPEVRRVMGEFASVRRVKLCVSSRVNAPAAVGFFRPAIVIPPWGLRELSVDELRVTLLHELAHLRRWDDWTNLVQQVVKAVLFFHPAVWWIEGRLALEREMACDDLVLSQTENPRAYAASLISFAEKIHRQRELALVHAVVGRVKQISQRVTRILDAKRPRTTRIWKPVVGLVTILSGAVLGAAPYAPRLVSFQEIPTTPVAAMAETRAMTTGTRLVPLAWKETAAKPQVLQARMRTRAEAVPVRRKLRSAVVPAVLQAKADQGEIQSPDMTMLMRSMRYDGQGSQVWTLCIWRVTQDNQGQSQVEAMFVVTKI
jgi:beta-lactamase regulating signal transducer with metallopeptidase domain